MRPFYLRSVCGIAMALIVLILSGCNELRTNRIYVKAIGFDYRDGEYIIHVQILDFSNEAKSESGNIANNKTPIWTGESRGKTLDEATDQLLNTSQERLDFSHVTSILMSPRALKKISRNDMSQLLAEYPELRLNIWVYGTNLPLNEVFITKAFFNSSNTSSLLHSPENVYRQRSAIEPVYLFKLIREMNHPAMSDYVPEISVDKSTWKMDFKDSPKMDITGAHFLQNGEYKGSLSRDQLVGWPWMNPTMRKWDLNVQEAGKHFGTATFNRTKVKVRYRMNASNDPVFDVDIHTKAVMSFRQDVTPLKEAGQAAAKIIEAQIRTTFRNALDKKVDVYQFTEIYYRKNYRDWSKRTAKGNRFILKEDSLGQIRVTVDMQIPGKYKP
ncbi:germination protein, Ger(x)C family [Paenibacillaceae bacterium GAS479]|nr:germination protein, Ger(x)C family [Paenibacillaceae bacterium GAS479]